MKLAPIQSFAQLKSKALKDKRYEQLAIKASDLFVTRPVESYQQALEILEDAIGDDGEKEIVMEINSCCGDVV